MVCCGYHSVVFLCTSYNLVDIRCMQRRLYEHGVSGLHLCRKKDQRAALLRVFLHRSFLHDSPVPPVLHHHYMVRR